MSYVTCVRDVRLTRYDSSGSPKATIYFEPGYYGSKVNSVFAAADYQDVIYSVYGSGTVVIDGLSQLTFTGGNSVTINGFTLNSFNGSAVVYTKNMASVYVYNCIFTSSNR